MPATEGATIAAQSYVSRTEQKNVSGRTSLHLDTS